MNIITVTSLLSPHRMRCSRKKQQGVVAIEFALVFMFGLLPLLLLTLAGVLIFAAKQSLTLAASNGARASLHYFSATDENLTDACSEALRQMKWLFAVSGSAPDECTGSRISSSDGSAEIDVTHDCTAATGATCVMVTTKYDYSKNPLIPATGSLYSWLAMPKLQSTAVIQIYNTQGS